MNEIVKEFNGSKVRIVEKDGIHWFVAKDICKYFGDSDHKRSISRLDKDEISLAKVKDSLGRMQNATVVNEPGLYHLLFNFQPEQARCKDGGARIAPQIKERVEKIRKFKRWVTHEVLPSIRKTGAYLSPGMSNEQVNRSKLWWQLWKRKCTGGFRRKTVWRNWRLMPRSWRDRPFRQHPLENFLRKPADRVPVWFGITFGALRK